MTDNETSASALKQSTAALFDRAAQQYDQQDVGFFRQLGRRLVEIAEPQHGQRVLDVGCGRGAVLFPIREAVGDAGLVHAIDLAPTMVDLCHDEVISHGWTNVIVEVGDAEQPELPDVSMDLVVSGLVLFFLPHPERAVANFHRVLRPGGRLAFSSFGAEDSRFTPVFMAMINHMPPPEEQPFNKGDDVVTPARDQESHFARTERVTSLLHDAGFVNINHVEQTHEFSFSTPQEWIDWSWTNGARMMWEAISEDRRADATHAVALELEAIAAERGAVTQNWNLRYTTAERPTSSTPSD